MKFQNILSREVYIEGKQTTFLLVHSLVVKMENTCLIFQLLVVAI